jgi:hypothetical protein
VWVGAWVRGHRVRGGVGDGRVVLLLLRPKGQAEEKDEEWVDAEMNSNLRSN